MSRHGLFKEIKEAIKNVEWAGKDDPATMETPNKELGEYMQNVLAAVDEVEGRTGVGDTSLAFLIRQRAELAGLALSDSDVTVLCEKLHNAPSSVDDLILSLRNLRDCGQPSRLARAVSKARGNEASIEAAIDFGNRAAASLKVYAEAKRCCTVCDEKKRCHTCNTQTLWACSDCAIDFGLTIYVCPECRREHERAYCPSRLRERLGITKSLATTTNQVG